MFWEYLRILREVNPKYFLLENVKMKKEYMVNISNILGYEPNRINSSLVSFQTRDRLYWTNINNGVIPLPIDKNVSLQDNFDTNIENLNEAKMNYTPSRIRMWNDGNGGKLGTCKNITKSEKSSNNFLKALKLKDVEINFDKNVYEYNANVLYNVLETEIFSSPKSEIFSKRRFRFSEYSINPHPRLESRKICEIFIERNSQAPEGAKTYCADCRQTR